MAVNESSVWYHAGLRFSCTQCGDCCIGEPGYVWVNGDEIAQLAQALALEPEHFRQLYVKRVGDAYSLRERSDGSCVLFQSGTGCTVYPVRPRQCRSWPFWESNLQSEKTWRETCAFCPGAGEGRLYSLPEILAQLRLIQL